MAAVLLIALATASNADDASNKAGLELFEKSVRPLFSQRCQSCHNGAGGVTRGGLALDSKEGWTTGGAHGPAIVPGQPDKSLLFKAVSYTNPNLQMPPGTRLGDEQITALKQWIELGAPDPRTSGSGKPRLTGLTDKARAHWAFQPIRKPPVPAIKDPKLKAWVKTPIDAFVLAKLREHGMAPGPQASREVLIRRVTYDLIGLPPTVDEVRAFLSDRSANAWEKVIDRLLASPHYGERWGRHWLDTARYGDTRGYANNGKDRYEGYQYPYAWTYRDYVIQAMNQDKPYNQFLVEQIAADKLPGIQPNDPRLAALGFLTVGKRFPNPDDTIDERIDALTKATLGLTVACARCHDHKFDPIPTADYYSLHGIFASIVEPLDRPVVVQCGDSAQRADFDAKLAALASENRDVIYAALRHVEDQFQEHAEGYLLVIAQPGRGTARYDVAKKYGLWPLDRDVIGNLRLNPQDPVLGPFAQLARIPGAEFENRAALLLPRILSNARTRVNPQVADMLRDLKPHNLEEVAHAYGDLFAKLRPTAAAYFDAQMRDAAGSRQSAVVNRQSDVLAASAPDRLSAPSTTTTTRLSAALSANQQPSTSYQLPNVAELIETPLPFPPASALATPEQQVDFFNDRTLYKPFQAQINLNNQSANRLLFGAIGELRLTHPGAPGCAMVVADAAKPHDSPIYIRGERNKRGPIVPRRFLEVLSGPDRAPFTDGSGRMELAQAIVSPRDPLPARVEVNRVWMNHLGEGFVPTPDDFGNQSERPSHPELLDWLASWFVENNWSLKRLHRLILLSSVYQESSAANPACEAKDPANRLLWRANLRRLDFEAIRDSMVMLTGKLDETLGGKPVNITDEPYTYRRSCYGYVDRNSLSDLLTQFDFADPDMANTRRISTIVPQQALFFLNSPMSVDVARQVVARPEVASAPDDAGKVRAIYLILFQRSPKPEEVQWATDFLAAAAQVAVNDAPKRPGANRQSPRPAPKRPPAGNRYGTLRNDGLPVSRAPLTPWELYTQALLCANEFVYVN
ncbi:MAG TPA: PSD1 and planctomycete cytochrome C domain-containing protein [Chthonomonadaceae bacterium]|nr:PSD1 and planctomycete cytochrome C domain-containing protein [Chthonomonadaceae bacterium]